MILGLFRCDCGRGNLAVRWPESPRGVSQCQWCDGLRWMPPIALRGMVLRWLADERKMYADLKWAEPGAEVAHRACVVGEGPTTWHDWAGNYVKRAVMFGLDTPQGRQALGKAIVTLMHVLETAVEEYGPMPRPGVPSGVIE